MTIIKYTLCLSFFMILSMASCNKKAIVVDEQEKAAEINQPTVEDVVNSDFKPGQTDMIPHSDEEDCHGVRKTIRSLENIEAEVMVVGSHYLLSIPPGTKRYKPCEIPKSMRTEGQKVTFSAIVLEIFPNERLMGTPIRLEKIIER